MRIEEGTVDTVLEGEYRCGVDEHGFIDISREGNDFVVTPLVGSKLITVNKYKQYLLDNYGLSVEDFEKHDVKGGWRTLRAPVIDFSVNEISNNVLKFKFKLSRGCYATVLINSLYS